MSLVQLLYFLKEAGHEALTRVVGKFSCKLGLCPALQTWEHCFTSLCLCSHVAPIFTHFLLTSHRIRWANCNWSGDQNLGISESRCWVMGALWCINSLIYVGTVQWGEEVKTSGCAPSQMLQHSLRSGSWTALNHRRGHLRKMKITAQYDGHPHVVFFTEAQPLLGWDRGLLEEAGWAHLLPPTSPCSFLPGKEPTCPRVQTSPISCLPETW